jgi:DNA-binding IclR family transcriptional regulator
MKTQSKTNSYHVPALEKGLDILEALSNAQNPCSLSDLSRILERSSSELFRMVDCLEKRGYIIKDELSNNYMLSLKLFELAHTHSPVDQLIRASYRPMWELASMVRESCHLSVLRHGKLVVLAQAESPEKLRLSVEVGSHFSIIHTVSGRLLLAHLSSDELEFLLAQNEEYQLMDPASQKTFHEKVSEIKNTGYLFGEDEIYKGIKDISVLVGNPKTGLFAALTIPYLTTSSSEAYKEELLNELRICAKSINESMGLD